MSFLPLQRKIHENARLKGFWDVRPAGGSGGCYEDLIPEKLCLIHSEVSEALETFRAVIPLNRVEFGEELADIMIRTMDLAEALKLDIDNLIQYKVEKNKGRPHKHGKRI